MDSGFLLLRVSGLSDARADLGVSGACLKRPRGPHVSDSLSFGVMTSMPWVCFCFLSIFER